MGLLELLSTYVDMKPISVNTAWKGRRFKTSAYKAFEKELLLRLPPIKKFDNDCIYIKYKFGMSNPRMDLDNPVKMVTDILQKKYRFDDSIVYRMEIEKVIVPKGQEQMYIEIGPTVKPK